MFCTTEEIIARIPAGNAADVDKAVSAARGAFAQWSQTSPDQRRDALERLAAGLEERQEELALAIAQEVGMPKVMAKAVSSWVESDWLSATGASFTGVTVMLTVAGALLSSPSLAMKVNESEPLKSRLGV